jgi:cephalosporin-C deacetylase-like acetyl esterase
MTAACPKLRILGALLSLAPICLCVASRAQKVSSTDPNEPSNLGRLELSLYLNNLAYQKTAARRITIAGITTQAQAKARQAEVHKKILALVGGLPEKTPLHARSLGTVQAHGFHIEKVIFDSQPNFPVTALLYLPDASPGVKANKFPAIVVAPGHGIQGKAGDYIFSSTFARNGFAVLDYDPIGQGERLEYQNAEPGRSLPGPPAATAEHGEAGLQPVLIGDAISRYFIWDGMRAVDYLQSRPEIDADRIGAFGCSGGGTITAMFAALDPRVKSIGVACFTTNFDTMLPAIGSQDAEQSIPDFIHSGFDIPDWSELAAPRPYAMIATYADMFPFPGAQQTENEARRFYQLFGANEQLEFLTGPGPHGAILPIFPSILTFFLKHLQPGADASHPVLPVALTPEQRRAPPADLPKDFAQVTPTGQVSTSYPGSETIRTLNLKRAATILAKDHAQPIALSNLQAAVRNAAKVELQPETGSDTAQSGFMSVVEEAAPHDSATSNAIDLHPIVMHVRQGIDLQGEIATPHSSSKHPAILMLTVAASTPPASPDHVALKAKLQQLAQAGNLVLALTPRPSPPGTEATKSPVLGDYYITELRAELTGKTIMGMRIDDTIRAVNYLSERPDVDPSRITAYGSYHLGLVLLHTAILDRRLAHTTVDHVLASYRSLLDSPLPLHASEDILPGVLRDYDIPDLVRALGPRLSLTQPLEGKDDLSADAMGTNAP